MMKKTGVIIIGIVVAVMTCYTANSQNLLIRNVSVINVVNGQIRKNLDIRIEEGIITKISKHSDRRVNYKGTKVIDAPDQYLLPGFVDTHVHTSLGVAKVALVDGKPALSMELDPELPKITTGLLIKYGITTGRDPGGKTEETIKIKRKIALGDVYGPELFVAGSIIDTIEFKNLTVKVTSEKEMIEEINRQKSAGVDFIKLYTSLMPELLETGIREAHRLGLETIAHLHAVSWTEASKMGVDNIVHIIPASDVYIPDEHKNAYHQSELFPGKSFYKWFEYVDLESEVIDDLIKTLKQNNTPIDPTLVVFHATFFENTLDYNTNELLDELPGPIVDNWRKAFDFNVGWTPQDFNDAQKTWPKVQKFTKMLHDNGILITAGTDTNNPWVVPGDGFHRELKLLTGCGLTNAEVLKIATLNRAKLLKIDDRVGTIETGKEADLVLLNADPLEDIENTRDIEMTIANGVIVYTGVAK